MPEPRVLTSARRLRLVSSLIRRYDQSLAVAQICAGLVLVVDGILFLAATVLAMALLPTHSEGFLRGLAAVVLGAVGVLLTSAAYSAAHALPHVYKARDFKQPTSKARAVAGGRYFNVRATLSAVSTRDEYERDLVSLTGREFLAEAATELWALSHQQLAFLQALRRGAKKTVVAFGALVVASYFSRRSCDDAHPSDA